mgnify:FL=1
MVNSNLAESIVERYVENGWAVPIDEITMASMHDSTQILLETIYDDTGDATGLNVFQDGIEILSLDYSDENFHDRLSVTLADSLNI